MSDPLPTTYRFGVSTPPESPVSESMTGVLEVSYTTQGDAIDFDNLMAGLVSAATSAGFVIDWWKDVESWEHFFAAPDEVV